MEQVKAWRESVVIPTYPVGKSDKNPMFFEKRVYQGSSGVVYPHPIIEKIYDKKVDKEYQAIFIENKYLKIMILPELGGRVQMAYDKIQQRHFIYYNQVVKPALVGLLGPWISGGIEFNWPQHHRPSTFDAVDCSIEEFEDGSKTIWVSEVEVMFRTKGMAGFTLHPDKAYLEIKAKLYNRTSQPQTFLWWANPAVSVDEHYQSVFPPDVHAVFDHGKRDVSTFPIATGTYYKMDYSAGVDISRYKNIPVPTSYMAVQSKYDFVGGYEHDTQAGVLHVANHHVSPGKKQWTWGHSDFGQAWDRNLTDEDGAYIELMTGVFTDNQPDFSWLQPFEEKVFTQYFMPYAQVGLVKNANKDCIVNIEVVDNQTQIVVYTTAEYQNLKIELFNSNELVFSETATVSPEKIWKKTLQTIVSKGDFKLLIQKENGAVLLEYVSEKEENKPVPEAAKAAFSPEKTENCEQLYLTGLHLEQYRHATYNPTDYYLEALQREPSDIRNNNAMGLYLFRKGQFVKSEPYFRVAIETLTQRNPNPYDSEAYYNLGLCLFFQERYDEAYPNFYKATWSAAFQDAGFFFVALIDCQRGDYKLGLEHVELSLIRNYHNHKARHLKTILLRKTNQNKKALNLIEDSLSIDLFNFGVRFEKYLILKTDDSKVELQSLLRDNPHTYIEYALDYAAAGCFEEAIELLSWLVKGDETKIYPLVYYFLAYFSHKNNQDSAIYLQKAAAASSDYCFPHRLETVAALQFAEKFNSLDSKAPYYLGNFWYDKRQYSEGIAAWEHSRSIDDSFATVHRNLALAYYNKLNNKDLARTELEKAFALDTKDARVLMELDQLYKKLNISHTERLQFLENHLDTTLQRDDLYLERATLYNQLGNYEKGLELIQNRIFHPWEGGEGKVTMQYLTCLIELSKQELKNGNYQKVVDLLKRTENYPHNLGEGKLYGVQENDINYYFACAYEGLKEESKAKYYFELASVGLDVPAAAMFYNDQQPDKIFYQGLAHLKLGNVSQAHSRFNNLLTYGQTHLSDEVKIDYFAVSLPDLLVFEDDLTFRNKIHCHYLKGLGLLGLGQNQKAKNKFEKVLKMDNNHQAAEIHSLMC